MKSKYLLFPLFLLFITHCSMDDDLGDESALSRVTISNNIDTQTTWNNRIDDPNKADYLVESGVIINAGLIIKPGVRIAFESESAFEITGNGFIEAIGTADLPIYFTGKSNVVGFWKGIVVTTDNAKNILSDCIIEFGGGSSISFNLPATNIGVAAGGQLTINNCEIRHSSGCGLASNTGGVLIYSDNTFWDITSDDICE